MKNVSLLFCFQILFFILYCSKGIALFTTTSQDITEFTSQIEAFLINKNYNSLTLAQFGAFESVFLKEQQRVLCLDFSFALFITVYTG